MAAGAILGERVTIAPGAVIYQGAEIGAGTVIGSGTVIHATASDRCRLRDRGLCGPRQAPRLRAGSSAAGGELGALAVGDGVTVCCGAVVYAGATIAAGAIIGDQAQVRERSSIGERTVLGRASCVDFNARVGARVLIQTAVYVTGGAVVEDDVFIGPGVIMTNDSTMGRHPRGAPLPAPVLRRACRVGGGVVVAPASRSARRRSSPPARS